MREQQPFETVDEETEPLSPDDTQTFSRAYCRWLKARAAIKDDYSLDEGAARGTFADERTALRELFALPAADAEQVWQKFEAFEAELTDERVVGETRDSVLPFALGSIKNDLANLGIGGKQ